MLDTGLTIFCIANIVVGIVSYILALYAYKKLKVIYKPPKVLRLYWIICYNPFAPIAIIGSVLFCFYILIIQDFDSHIYKTSRLILKFSMQQIRASMIVTLIERILATIFLDKWAKVAESYVVLFVLTAITYATSAIYTFSSAIFIFFLGSEPAFQLTTYSIMAFHSMIIIICKLLHVKNKKMYRMLAFRVTLKQRHQILENLKFLSYYWKGMLILSICAPLGSVTSLIYYVTLDREAPLACFYLFYNIAFLIIGVSYIKDVKIQESGKIHDVTQSSGKTIMSALGKSLPAHITIDTYFEELKQQWEG